MSDPPLLEFRGFLSDFNLTLAIFNITFPAYFQFNKLIYFGKDSFSIYLSRNSGYFFVHLFERGKN